MKKVVRTILAVGLTLAAALLGPRAQAWDELPPALAPAVLDEWSAATFAPADFTVDDYALEWLGQAPRGVRVRLEPGSLQWVQIAPGLQLPRAVLVLEADDIRGGTLLHANAIHPLTVDRSGGGRIELPIALLSTADHAIRVRLQRGDVEHAATLRTKFRPRPAHRGAILVDSTCSPFGLRARRGAIPPDSWMRVGCRMVPVAGGDGPRPTLELTVYWDNVGRAVRVDGIETRSRPAGIWQLRVRPDPGTVRLSSAGHEVRLGYRLPPRLHAAFVGAGVGPYLYRFEDPDTDLHTAANLLTVYASYTIAPTTRIVYFNATPLHVRSFADQGLYLWTEQFRLFDGRASVNLLLGVHALLFQSTGELRFVPSFPQGLEGVFRDFGARGHNLSGGAFIYPEIADRSYYNLWARWGSARLFWELNYISWKEPLQRGHARTESLGVSVGLPLLRFL